MEILQGYQLNFNKAFYSIPILSLPILNFPLEYMLLFLCLGLRKTIVSNIHQSKTVFTFVKCNLYNYTFLYVIKQCDHF